MTNIFERDQRSDKSGIKEAAADHVCFGCQRQIGSMQRHIHVPLDEWSGSKGLAPLGLDDLLTFAFCEACVQTGGSWQLEAHPVAASTPEETT